MTNDPALIDDLIGRAAAYVRQPPGGDDPVVSLASPDALRDIFEGSVGLSIGADAVAHDRAAVLAAGVMAMALGGCEPTVKLAAPDKPIVINLNVKIEREVRVKVEREIEDVIRENEEIF